MAIAGHDTLDRFVIEFDGPLVGDASYSVEMVDLPFTGMIEEGLALEVEGSVGIHLVAPIMTYYSEELDYSGPKRLSGADAGTTNLREVAYAGGYEGMADWVIGFDEVSSYQVTMVTDPARLVLDVCK